MSVPRTTEDAVNLPLVPTYRTVSTVLVMKVSSATALPADVSH